jgi:N-acetylglutamate synthase-like GNAT family acetyltransferase
MNPGPAESSAIMWHEEPRAPLRHLFELADDSSTQIDSYIDLGRVLVARAARGEILGHLQLIPTASADTIELKSIAVRENHQRTGSAAGSSIARSRSAARRAYRP